MPTCEICQGLGRVRLMVHREVSAAYLDDDVPELAEQYRTFPCPECADSVSVERVRVCKVITEYDAARARMVAQPIQRALAAQFGVYLMKKGYVSFGIESKNAAPGTLRVTASLGVVRSPTTGTAVDEAQTEIKLSEKLESKMRERGIRDLGMSPASARLEVSFPDFKKPLSPEEQLRAMREAGDGRFRGLDFGEDAGDDD